MTPASDYKPSRGLRFWGVLAVAVLIVATALIRIKTLLGVEALTVIGTTIDGDPIYDKVGREAIWRIWWRVRDDVLPDVPQWARSTGLFVLLAVFVISLLAATWFALSPDPAAESQPE